MSNSVAFTGLEAQSRRLRAVIQDNIAAVLDHGQFIMGPEVKRLETKLTEYCGAKHAIAVANGTDALQIALMAQGVGAGDAVFVPSFTYTATAEVILILGARPVFVEVDPTTFNIECDDLEAKITSARAAGMRPRAVIGVDLFGLPADWIRLNQIADAHGLVLVADSAQSFGAVAADGRRVGTLAPVTTTSFFPAKPLGCYGDGGAIFTDDDGVAEAMRSIRVHGQGVAKYETVRLGMNSRLDTIQAAILLAKIDVFAEEVMARNVLADRYHLTLSGVFEVPVKPAGTVSAWAQYTLQSDARDALQSYLKGCSIPTAIYYPKPMHLQPAYAAYGDGPGSMPVSERLSQRVISIPMNPYWEESDVVTVISALKAFAQTKAADPRVAA